MVRHQSTVLLAIALAAVAIWTAGTAFAIQVSYTISEGNLSKILNANRYGGHQVVWADIRREPVTAFGKTYPGHISVHARDVKGNECIWYLVIEPKLQSNWFVPRIFNRDRGCWSSEVNDDGSVLAYGLSAWRNDATYLLSQRAPIGNPIASLNGKVEYYTNKTTLFVVEAADIL
jgi:hypothetical protein